MFNDKEDIEDKDKLYHKWDIYAIDERKVIDEEEKRDLDNRMVYILTGKNPFGIERK